MNAGIDGELVRKLRTVKSWSQEELGQISGLSARTIQRIETEGSGSLDSRRALASAFGLRPEDLLAVQPGDTGGGAEPAQDRDQSYVDRPRLGAGYAVMLWFGVGLSLMAMLLAIVLVSLGLGGYGGPPPGLLWVSGAVVLGITGYSLSTTANTTYRLSAQGLQVRFGPHRRNYRWEDFATAYWRRGMLPVRLTFQPVTRYSDVVTLEPRDGGSALDLTPHDSEDFMRQIAALAPQLAHGRRARVPGASHPNEDQTA